MIDDALCGLGWMWKKLFAVKHDILAESVNYEVLLLIKSLKWEKSIFGENVCLTVQSTKCASYVGIKTNSDFEL